MMRIWLCCLLVACCTSVMDGQGVIPDADFENWTNQGSFEEPTSDWWTSLNELVLLTAPVSVEKTTDAHSGTYAAKMTTKQWGFTLVPGLLVAGDFDANSAAFVIQGQPFTDRPDVFTGWYKYTSVNGDSAAIAAYLTRWNGIKRDTLAEATLAEYVTVSNYTQFILPFIYNSQDTPDTILLALVSSAGGQSFQGQPGATLWVDDIALQDWAAVPEAAPLKFSLGPSPATTEIRLSVEAVHPPFQMRLYNAQGQLLRDQQIHASTTQIDVREFPAGTYVLELMKDERRAVRKFIVR
ncbi:MAG: PCMD domain-containing protein [Bacteroidota bacterium]